MEHICAPRLSAAEGLEAAPWDLAMALTVHSGAWGLRKLKDLVTTGNGQVRAGTPRLALMPTLVSETLLCGSVVS